MRREILRAVFLKELRETLRDRRSLAVMFGIRRAEDHVVE